MAQDGQALLELRYNEAIAHHQAGELAAAVAAYQAVLALEPAHITAYNNLGTALKALGRHREAIDAYRSAIALDPGYAAALYNLGTVYHQTGDLKQAFRLYDDANRLRPNDVNTVYNMAAVAEHGQLFDYAASLYEQVTALQPGHAKALAARARCLGQLGRVEAALGIVGALLEQAPQDASVWCLAGEICLDDGRWDEASRYLQRTLALAPAAMDVRMQLAFVLLKLARYADALAMADEVLRLAPGYLPVQMLRGHALQGLGRHAEAAEALERGRQVSGVATTWLEQALRTASLPSDNLAIERSRYRYGAALENAVAFGGTVGAAEGCLGRTPFYYAYQGRNDRDIMAGLAQALPRICPELRYVAPHCQ